jgi:hypothetical protein
VTTSARYKALQWFLDHEALGPDEMLTRRPPSARMRRLMAREGQVMRLPIGQFEYQKWLLTPLGKETLQNKPQGKRRGERDDVSSEQRTRQQ